MKRLLLYQDIVENVKFTSHTRLLEHNLLFTTAKIVLQNVCHRIYNTLLAAVRVTRE